MHSQQFLPACLVWVCPPPVLAPTRPPSLPAKFPTTSSPGQDIKRWRESELVHGRVAMLASLGFIVQEQTMVSLLPSSCSCLLCG